MRIALIGTGNVAWHLARVCQATGHNLEAVVGSTLPSGKEFANFFTGTQATTLEELQNITADVVLIAVPDAALADVATTLSVKPNTVVAHTSGSQPIGVLDAIAGVRSGVFYPVQTFTKYKTVDFSQVPILIEGINEATTQILTQLGRSISSNVQVKDSAARKQLHLAAVFACNFTNHLFGISQAILKDADLPTDLLQPLIQETVAKASTSNPFTVQTGPAARNDTNVIQEHIRILQGHPAWQDIYRKLTQCIQEQQKGTTTSNDNN